MKLLRVVFQVIILSVFSLIGNFIATTLHWHIPGSLIGLVVLFVLLQLNIVKVSWVELGASWLLAEMLLFYVPSVVGIIQYGHLIQVEGIRLVILVSISTALVMMSTGVIADKLSVTLRRKSGGESSSC